MFRPENIQFARELSRARVPFFFRVYSGGHTQTLWTGEAPTWLAMLPVHLTARSWAGRDHHRARRARADGRG